MKTLVKILKLAIIFILLIVIVFKLYSNRKQLNNTIERLEQKSVLIPVEVIKPREIELNKQFEYSGVFEAKNNLSLISEVNGKVEKLNVSEGSRIAAGEELICVENKIFKAQLDLAAANLKDSEKNLNRFKNLEASNAVSTKQLEDIQMAHQQAKLSYELALLNFENSFIKSPINGVVNEYLIEVGTFVTPGLAVANILNLDSLIFSTKVSESDILEINYKDKVIIIPQISSKKEILGNVNYISSKADESKKYELKVCVNNHQGLIKPGMFAKASISPHSDSKKMVIPRKCLEGSLKDPKVYIIKNNKAYLVSINTEEVIGDFIVIKSGLSISDTIVINGQINLDNGTDVRIL